MEQAHTQLIAQLNERIAAADNTPLYMKFAQTVKNAVRSGILEHGNILPGERDLSQLTGVSRITVRKAMQALEEEGVVTRARGYGTQINNIFEYSLKEARGFSQQVVLRGKKPDTLWVNKRIVPCPEEVAQQLAVAAGSDVFLLKRIRYVDEDAVSIEESWVPVQLSMMWMPSAFRCTTIFAASISSRSARVHASAPGCLTQSSRHTFKWTAKCRCW